MARTSNTQTDDKTSAPAQDAGGFVFEDAPRFAPRGGGRNAEDNIFSGPLKETYETQKAKQVAVLSHDADNCRTMIHRAAKDMGIGADVRVVKHPQEGYVYVQFRGRERHQRGDAATVQS